VYVVRHSELENETNCYSQVMEDTCNVPDANLMTMVIYDLKFWQVVNSSCALGKSSVFLLILFDCSLIY